MSTEAQLKAISNSELASGNQIPALKHRTVNNAIIEEMYDAQSRADVLAGVQTAVSIASGDQVLVIRSGQAYLLDSSEFGFVDALADLTDVSIPTPANDQVLAYNTATSKWVAKDVNTLTSVVSISGTATTNALTKFTGTSSIGNSNIVDDGSTIAITGNLAVNTDDLYINSTNGRVGIGTASPATNFQVSGNILADFVSTTGNSYTKIFSMDQDIQTTDLVEFLTVTAGSFITTGGTSSQFVKGNGTLDSTDYQNTSEKGQANGYAPLDSGAKVAEAYLPDSVLGQVSYQGTWDASTNTPTLANPPASTTKGEYYVTSVAGTQFSIDFQVGDWIISNGTSWEKVDNTDAVTSVFGRLGNIVANESDYASFYVDFDSDQSITGQKTFGSGDLRIVSGGSGNLPTIFINSSVGSSTESGFNSLGFNGSNDFYFTKGVGASFNGAIFSYDNAAIRTYNLQDASGTLAFLSDIPPEADTLDSVTDRGNTTTNAITVGGATINGNLTVNNDLLANNVTIPNGEFYNSRRSSGNLSLPILGHPSGSDTVRLLSSEGFSFVNGALTEHMRINSSGNVGIGTSSPQRQLHVNGSTGALRLEGTSVGGYVEFVSPTSTTFIGHPASISSGSTDDFAFYVAGAERMRIDASGNVGIGTSSPSAKLEVAGGATFNGDLVTGAEIYRPSTDSYLRINGASSGVTGASILMFGDTHSSAAGRLALTAVGSESVIFNTGGSERMRIDSSGNVGIGIISPDESLVVNGGIKIRGTNYLSFTNTSDQTYIRAAASNILAFGTDSTERMRINSSGDVVIGPTTIARINLIPSTDGLASPIIQFVKSDAASQTAVQFIQASLQRGSITYSSTGTAYNTTSDYRLKENVVPIEGALDRVNALKPSRFNFISDPEKTVDGFLAHEAAEVVPEAVTGEKDAMREEEYEVEPAVYDEIVHPAQEEVLDDDGNVVEEAKEEWTEKVLVSEAVMGTRLVPEYQGIDQSKLVPLLVGAIQELRAEIETLKQQINGQ